MQELSDWILPNNALLFSPQEWLRKTICVAHADHIQWESLECKSPVDSRAFQTSSKRNCYYCPLPALPKCHSILSLVEFVLVSASHSVVSCPLWPHGLCSPWNSPGHNTGVDSLSFSRGSSQLRDGIQALGSSRDRIHVSCIGRKILYYRVTWKDWFGKISGVGKGNSFQYSYLENFIDRGVWWLQFVGS